jgi:Kef-type K+ transport system membrane component KefB
LPRSPERPIGDRKKTRKAAENRGLLPLFFAWSGLRTDFRLLFDSATLAASAVILIVAIAGKLGGVSIAARACGIAWPEALKLGVLMNTRGLMELVALNIGYDLGLVPKNPFAAFVVMAVVTTCATSPLLRVSESGILRLPRLNFPRTLNSEQTGSWQRA